VCVPFVERIVTSSEPLVTTHLAQRNCRRHAGKYWRILPPRLTTRIRSIYAFANVC